MLAGVEIIGINFSAVGLVIVGMALGWVCALLGAATRLIGREGSGGSCGDVNV